MTATPTTPMSPAMLAAAAKLPGRSKPAVAARRRLLGLPGHETTASRWSADQLDVLRARFAAGDTNAQIAAAVGGQHTASSVAGKLDRLGLARRAAAVVTAEPVLPRRLTPDQAARVQLPPLPEPGACKWIEGPRGDFRLCGERALAGRAYCAVHCGAAYQPGSGRVHRDSDRLVQHLVRRYG